MLLPALLLATACTEEPEVAVYAVPSEAVTPMVVEPVGPAQPAGEVVPPPTASGGMPYVVPDGWREREAAGAMRVATFDVGEGDRVIEVAVSQFPGDVGGLLANVNRWRGQVGLGPIAEAELAEAVEAFDGGPGFHGHTMRLRGEEQHLLGAAIHEHGADRTWFVKAVADPDVADLHAEAVFAFARSFGRAAEGAE